MSSTCEQCGAVLSARRNRFCSLKCHGTYNSIHNRKKANLKCEQCGQEFYPRRHGGGKDANRFCSRGCAGLFHRESRWIHFWFKNCERCGVRFVTQGRNAKLCSSSCCVPKPVPKCPICGSDKPKWKTYCTQCQEVRSKEQKRKYRRDARREGRIDRGSTRARVSRANVPYAAVSRNAVLKRYGKRCWICGKSIDMAAAAPHPQSYSIDHIVPLSLGGWHDLPNLRPAHFECNRKRGAEYSGQLMLCYQ